MIWTPLTPWCYKPHREFFNRRNEEQVGLVLHDDAKREYAYGLAQVLLATKVDTFTQALYDEAKKQGWTVISLKND